VTRRTVLPSHDDVQLAIKRLTETTGKPPTVLALARHLGLANTTFRRHFPDITTELTQQRSPAPADSDPVAASRFEKIQRENTELRRARRPFDIDAYVRRSERGRASSARSSKDTRTTCTDVYEDPDGVSGFIDQKSSAASSVLVAPRTGGRIDDHDRRQTAGRRRGHVHRGGPLRRHGAVRLHHGAPPA
jgi:hypothetical protein